MKKFSLILFSLFLVFGYSNAGLFSSREVVDKIIARVNGVNILKSDLQKPRMSKNGKSYDLREAIIEESLLQKSVERKLLPTEIEVQKQIVSLKIHNNMANLSDEQFEEELREEGFTLDEYKKQLARMLSVERLKQTEFNERVVVTSQQVEDYHKSHPVYAQEEYLLKSADLGGKNVNEKGELVSKDNIKWDDLGWIKKEEVGSNISFVKKMKKGEISDPVKIGADYQIIKLEDKKEDRVKSLDESYVEIERTLQEQKKDKFEKDFEKELEDKATIIYLD